MFLGGSGRRKNTVSGKYKWIMKGNVERPGMRRFITLIRKKKFLRVYRNINARISEVRPLVLGVALDSERVVQTTRLCQTRSTLRASLGFSLDRRC